jgi:CRP-like cAMP-binding protein
MEDRSSNHVVSVLECDPDLGEDLDEAQLNDARVQAYASVRCYPRGRWQVPRELEATASLGLLIVRGYIARELTTADYTAAELLGPGDLVQPWLRPAFEQAIPGVVSWTVVQRVRVVVLDRAFLARVSEWPEIAAALAGRLSWRTHWLAFQLALSGMRRVEDRVVLMLWQFGERWGTVTPDGVLLDLPLTHELLASLIGARRPSVSVAVRRLVENHRIRSRRRSRWLLLRQTDDAP